MKIPDDIEALKEIGIDFPKDFVFSKHDWIDLFRTLARFKFRVMQRRYNQSFKRIKTA